MAQGPPWQTKNKNKTKAGRAGGKCLRNGGNARRAQKERSGWATLPSSWAQQQPELRRHKDDTQDPRPVSTWPKRERYCVLR